MYRQNDLLRRAADELRQSLAENRAIRGREWAIRVGKALARVEQTLRRHAGESGAIDENAMDQDRALLPSPGVERRAEGLRHDLDARIATVRGLRTELASGSEPAPDGTGPGVSDRIREVLRQLEQLQQQEIDLVQEAITADIGAGD